MHCIFDVSCCIVETQDLASPQIETQNFASLRQTIIPCPEKTKRAPHTRCPSIERIIDYNLGPAATKALPAALPVYFTKFFWKREAKSFAFVSHSEALA